MKKYRINKDGYYETGRKQKGITNLMHRVVLEEHLGRKLLSTEIVHHKDHNKLNNDLSNLELLNNRRHAFMHTENTEETKKCKICNEQKNRNEFCSKGRSKAGEIIRDNKCRDCRSGVLTEQRIRIESERQRKIKILKIFKMIGHSQ